MMMMASQGLAEIVVGKESRSLKVLDIAAGHGLFGIAVLRANPVIAYPDEESLRELIAGPSIIACGFASREEAQTNIDADFWTAALELSGGGY
jgi:hypothetical protein